MLIEVCYVIHIGANHGYIVSSAQFLATCMNHHIEHMHKMDAFKKEAAAIISTSVATLHPRSLHALFHTCTFIRGYKGENTGFLDHVCSYKKMQFVMKILRSCCNK